MTPSEIVRLRLVNQHIAATTFTKPQQIVSHLLAIQAQDFAMAKWAIGLRVPGTTDASIEKLFNEGKILRTHLLRPTWHFVMPEDLRWLVTLTAPRVKKIMTTYNKQLGLTPALFKKSKDIFVRVLEGGKYLTRAELRTALGNNKLAVDKYKYGNTMLAHMLMEAELDCIICSGPRAGKQFTYTLLDERAPNKRSLDREEALAEITKRYFTTRGPATVQDFMWWSGLPAADARAGIATLPSSFRQDEWNGRAYIYRKQATNAVEQNTFLLPDYDEYGIAYKNRDEIYNPKGVKGELRDGHSVFNHIVIVDGLMAGTWERQVRGTKISVTTNTIPLNKRQQSSLKKAVAKYTAFVSQ